MKIAVVGLWHLGSVTAACLANAGHQVIGYDPDQITITKLQQGQAPIFEPGLNELIAKNLASQQLTFSADLTALSQAEIIWVTFDTPVDDNDIADVEFVTREIEKTFPHL
jgi:UDPglucose 6-dehydrogenase